MARIIKDENLLGATGALTVKPYGDDPVDFDTLECRWLLDPDNNPGPSQYFREQGYFKVGDIIRASNGIGRIIAIFSEYRDYRGEFIVKYRVQYVTKKGNWSKLWSYEYPGFIQRAYASAGDPLAVKEVGENGGGPIR